MTSAVPPTVPELLDALPADPAPRWPAVPPVPVEPGTGWQGRRAGSGQLVWFQPLVSVADAGTRWLEHRGRFGATGLWPVLVDDAFWEAVELEPFEATAPFADTRALLQRLAQHDPEDPGVPRGPLPDVVPDHRTPQQVVDAAEEPTGLVLVPARAGWVVPQLLGWDGSVNHEIHGREHSAVLGRWAGLYGAELYGLTRDVVQLLVTRPPTQAYARLLAALEIYAYCPDVVEQGVGTLDALVAMASSPEWWLWWD